METKKVGDHTEVTEADSKKVGKSVVVKRIIYLVVGIVILIGLMLRSHYSGDKKGPHGIKKIGGTTKIDKGQTFNVAHDIIASGEDSVASYEMDKDSIGVFNTTDAQSLFVEMGEVEITAGGKTKRMTNSVWNTPGTPDAIFNPYAIWKIRALSKGVVVSFSRKNKNTKKQKV